MKYITHTIGVLGILALLAFVAWLMLPTSGSYEPKERVRDAANLSAIAKACLIYAVEHDNYYPPSLQFLVQNHLLDPKYLISPFDKNPSQEGSYIYLGNGIKESDTVQDAMQLILAHGKPELYDDKGLIVVYMDVHTDFVEMERFEADLERTEQWIKQYKATTQPTSEPADESAAFQPVSQSAN